MSELCAVCNRGASDMLTDDSCIGCQLDEARRKLDELDLRPWKDRYEANEREIASLRHALMLIANWRMPMTPDGLPYSMHWGTNGERDVIRKIAREALGVAYGMRCPPGGIPDAAPEKPPATKPNVEAIEIGAALERLTLIYEQQSDG